ncbi:MAG: Tat proofreading chaperone DmsD [Sodalis sp. (in: enterobacteria)]|uniref:Tat proofreading chaperone DmsD n=1 Tax=Sodalis sp. (in: enterobacteria) TaxID=1898979 RepID=UPI003FD7C203
MMTDFSPAQRRDCSPRPGAVRQRGNGDLRAASADSRPSDVGAVTVDCGAACGGRATAHRGAAGNDAATSSSGAAGNGVRTSSCGAAGNGEAALHCGTSANGEATALCASPEEALRTIAFTGRTLGALLYYSPARPEQQPLLHALAGDAWLEEWPALPGLAEAGALMQQGLVADQRATLEQEFQRLFLGPHALPAPQWGSVYLDEESVVYGESTLALRAWLRQRGIAPALATNEPEDHCGLLLLLSAWLAENAPSSLDTLLEEHLLPWAPRFLTLLCEGTVHPFYQGLGRLTRITLAHWRQYRGLTPPVRKLYR